MITIADYILAIVAKLLIILAIVLVADLLPHPFELGVLAIVANFAIRIPLLDGKRL